MHTLDGTPCQYKEHGGAGGAPWGGVGVAPAVRADRERQPKPERLPSARACRDRPHGSNTHTARFAGVGGGVRLQGRHDCEL